jgi:hypothetical protein
MASEPAGVWKTALEKVWTETAIVFIVILFIIYARWPSPGDTFSMLLCLLLIAFGFAIMIIGIIKNQSKQNAKQKASFITYHLAKTLDSNLSGIAPDPRGRLLSELAERFQHQATRGVEEPYKTLFTCVAEEFERERLGFGNPQDFMGPVPK